MIILHDNAHSLIATLVTSRIWLGSAQPSMTQSCSESPTLSTTYSQNSGNYSTGKLSSAMTLNIQRLNKNQLLGNIHTQPLAATTSDHYLWMKSNVRPLQRHKWLDQWRSSTENKMHFLYFLILWRLLVSVLCIRTYIIMYNQWFCRKKSLSHRWGSTMENQWLATNFSGNHLSLTCGHSHLCTYKVSVSTSCGCHK